MGANHNLEPEPWVVLRARAMESLLIEKGLITTEMVDRIISAYENDIGPMIGARIVARAWTEADFRGRLLADSGAAVKEFGIDAPNLIVVANTPVCHNMVVCTLCSCYPVMVLGLPPSWYKSFAYRSRAVLEPRAVLHEFGCDLPESVVVRVWDSSSDVRYMVLPERPAGTEGLSEQALAALVTRDAMIGTARVAPPALVPAGA